MPTQGLIRKYLIIKKKKSSHNVMINYLIVELWHVCHLVTVKKTYQ